MPAGLSEASRRLDALVLTTLVLDPIFGIDAAALTAGAVTFTEDANEAYRYCPKLATGMVFSILDE